MPPRDVTAAQTRGAPAAWGEDEPDAVQAWGAPASWGDDVDEIADAMFLVAVTIDGKREELLAEFAEAMVNAGQATYVDGAEQAERLAEWRTARAEQARRDQATAEPILAVRLRPFFRNRTMYRTRGPRQDLRARIVPRPRPRGQRTRRRNIRTTPVGARSPGRPGRPADDPDPLAPPPGEGAA